jgi:hypothetical protein
LGDAVLELLTSEYLLTNFPEWSEGQLSKSRARIVNAHSWKSQPAARGSASICAWVAEKKKPAEETSPRCWPTPLKLSLRLCT